MRVIGLGSQVQPEGTAGSVALVLAAQGQVGLCRHSEEYMYKTYFVALKRQLRTPNSLYGPC